MELIPIIEATLSIFLVVTGFILAISYLIYKLRSQTSKKAFLDQIALDNDLSVIIEKSRIIGEDNKSLEKVTRFKVLNEFTSHLNLSKDIGEPSQKIKIVQTKEKIYKFVNRKEPLNPKLNIFSLYSSANGSIRPMHKINLEQELSV